MALSPIIQKFVEYQKLKELMELSEERMLLKKIDRQTSNSSGIVQNIIGNVITDGGIFLLKKIFRI